MTISVTQEHIDKGERCDAQACALALAFESAGFDTTVKGVSVDFYRHDDECVGSLSLPPVAMEFVRLFDDGEFVEPFAFEMPGLTSDLRSLTSDFTPVPVT